MDTEREMKLMEELEHVRRRAADRDAELHAEQKERASRDLELAEERRRTMYLEDELEAARRDRAELAQAAAEVCFPRPIITTWFAEVQAILQAREVGSLAGKVAGGVILCTVLWDAVCHPSLSLYAATHATLLRVQVEALCFLAFGGPLPP